MNRFASSISRLTPLLLLACLLSGTVAVHAGEITAERACKKAERAAKRGSAVDQFKLAKCYAGDGRPIDYALARHWLEQAIAGGNAEAYADLGVMYEQGQSVEADLSKACDLYLTGAQLGSAQNAVNVSNCYLDGSGNLPQDHELSARWLEAAAKQDHLIALDVLAARYLEGFGIDRNLPRALQLREARLRVEDDGATAYALATQYLYGVGTEPDRVRAAHFFQRSANAGFAPAHNRSLEAETRATLVMEPCWFEHKSGYVVSCGHLVVPEDWSRADSPQISMAFVVASSVSKEPREAAPLIELGGGGPGGSLLEAEEFDPRLDAMVRYLDAGHEVIWVDLRGSGRSTPALRCDREEKELLAAAAAAKTAEQWMRYQTFVRSCLRRHQEAGVDLKHYKTADAVKDVDALREALGYERWLVFGVSYATRVAAELAAEYPATVEALVLDSPALHSQNLTAAAADVDRALARLIEACRGDRRCSNKYGDVGELLPRVVSKLNSKPVHRTITHPEGTSALGLWVDGGKLLDVIYVGLYSTYDSRGLPRMLKALDNGSYDLLDQYLAKWLALSTGKHWFEGLAWSTACQEDVTRLDIEAFRQGFLQTTYFKALPIDTQIERSVCSEFFPNAKQPAFDATRITAPVLVMHGYLDPVTPYDADALKSLGHTQLWVGEFPDLAHSVTSFTQCTDEVALAFFADPRVDPFQRHCFQSAKPLKWGEAD